MIFAVLFIVYRVSLQMQGNKESKGKPRSEQTQVSANFCSNDRYGIVSFLSSPRGRTKGWVRVRCQGSHLRACVRACVDLCDGVFDVNG